MTVRTIGNITLDFVEPDTLRMTWKKSFAEAEADALLAFTDELLKRPGMKPLLFHLDVHEASGIDSRSRKKIAELTKAKPYVATAIVGASFPIRVAIELIINAARLLVKDAAETRFFATDEEATAWFAEVRARDSAAA